LGWIFDPREPAGAGCPDFAGWRSFSLLLLDSRDVFRRHLSLQLGPRSRRSRFSNRRQSSIARSTSGCARLQLAPVLVVEKSSDAGRRASRRLTLCSRRADCAWMVSRSRRRIVIAAPSFEAARRQQRVVSAARSACPTRRVHEWPSSREWPNLGEEKRGFLTWLCRE